MDTMTIERDTFEDLVDTKLKVLQDEIHAIMNRWQYMDIHAFLNDARDGSIEDAEDDAVCLKNLVEKHDMYYHLRHRRD